MYHDGAKLLPFYLIVDVSISMAGDKLDSANRMLPAIVDALAQNPILSDKVRFGLIDFSNDAQIRLPLCDLLEPSLQLPTLSVRGGTSYSAAFRALKSEIQTNVAQLKADQYIVHRPTAWFISDGAPTDPDNQWRQDFANLTSSSMYPNFIPCGVDGADPAILSSLVYPNSGSKPMAMYMMDPGFEPAKAITAMAEVLISSMLASGYSLATGQSGTILPPRSDLPAGISQFDPDDFV